MPSGYTHCFLVRLFNEKSIGLKDDLAFLLSEKIKYFQLGAIGPDLPYSQIPRPQNKHEKIADKFHLENANELPLRALSRIKGQADGSNKDEAFSFFLGFISHIVADGIIHPFVRDKVGDYHENQTEHRVLEMKLDVIFLNEITKGSGSGQNLNFTNYHEQLKDPLSRDFSHVSKLMADLINEIYGEALTSKDIEDWIDDMHDLFAIAEGENNQYYAFIPGMKNFLFPHLSAVIENKDQYLVLKKNEAKGRDQNFLGKDVHFLDDCVPMFYKAFTPIAIKAYEFIYENGSPLSDTDFPVINLDTGRRLKIASGNDLNQAAAFWEMA